LAITDEFLGSKWADWIAQSPVERYWAGYPRYAALLSAHPALHNFRRFTRVCMRLLLLKQDEISVLEERLDRIDDEEGREFRWGCSRYDDNDERLRVVERLQSSLAEYGKCMSCVCNVFLSKG
jgi:hypothetical protein